MELKAMINSKEQKFHAQILNGQLWIHFNGQTHVVDSPSNQKRKKAGSHFHKNEVHAPMPGKITKINVLVDQVVTKGEPVVVMEAMKMEYTLKADVSGRVRKINCKELDQVSLGQLLVDIESEASQA